MTTKHTPGPWSLNIEDGRAEVCVDGERLTDPYIGDENARLIAAAPDLLVAVQRCLNFIEGTEAELGEEFECGNLARAAIAKAEGRS